MKEITLKEPYILTTQNEDCLFEYVTCYFMQSIRKLINCCRYPCLHGHLKEDHKKKRMKKYCKWVSKD